MRYQSFTVLRFRPVMRAAWVAEMSAAKHFTIWRRFFSEILLNLQGISRL